VPYATDNAFSDDVISRYIYGDGGRPSDLTDESIIRRLDNGHTQVTEAQYMAGPGRFASPVFFEAIRKFFTLSNNEILGLIENYRPIENRDTNRPENRFIDYDEFGNVTITKEALFEILGIGNAGLRFHQGIFDDGQDDYFQRTFIWGTTDFKIEDGALFKIDANGSNRRIENFAIVSRTGGDGFDFEGGALSNFLRPIAEPLLDPYHLGETVNIAITGSVTNRTYTQSNYVSDLANVPLSISGIDHSSDTVEGQFARNLLDYAAATAALGATFSAYFQRIHGAGVVQYYQDGYHLFYGTSDSDTIECFGLNPLINYPHVNFYPGQPNGVRVIAADGSDIVNGDIQFNNYLEGGAGNDTLTGGTLADTLDGGEGADQLYGGFGDDTLIIDAADTVISGGFGTDTADLVNFASGVQWLEITGDSNGELSERIGAQVSGIEKIVGTRFDDTFTLAVNAVLPDGNLEIDGGGGNDIIIGNDSENTFWGGDGDDVLDGGSDDDILRGGAGDDSVLGGADNDLLFGDAGNDIVDGQDGNDTLYGGTGNDRLIGGSGEDTIYGEGDDDRIFGGTGADQVYGSAGDDIVSGGFNLDTPTDYNSFEDGAVDRLTGGNGADIFIGNDGDVITDLEYRDQGVFLGNLLLRGGRRSKDDPNGTYSGANGERYQLSGSTLKIRYRGAELTILQFNNEDARIKLTEDVDKPDPDTAERNRDPLVIDLDGDQQVALNNGRRSVYFDMNSDGFAELSAWVRQGDGLLALDRKRAA
jgi:Ca2+-binding RTX toxin-like protein